MLVLRSSKGSPLTQSELDGNQVFLQSRLGTWSSVMTYNENQMVTFLGNVYRSVVNSNTNNLPNLSSQWELYRPPHTHGFADIASATSTDVLLSANSNTLIPTQRAVKTYVDSAVSSAGYTNEQAQDTVAAALIAGSSTSDFQWAYDDAAGTITGSIKDGAILGSDIANNTIGLPKLANQLGPCVVGRGTGTGSLTSLTLASNLSIAGSTLGLTNVPSQSLLGAEAAGAPTAIGVGNLLTISSSQLRTNIAQNTIMGRFSEGTGQAEQLTLGSGLSIVGGALNATGEGYTFTNTTRLYGRSTAGSGPGEEISLGAGLSLVSGVLSSSGGGYTFTNTTRLYGRSTAGSGPGEEISLGTGLSLVSGVLSSSSSYTFTNTTRLYGRSTAGSGPGEEISLGAGLSLVSGVLSATGGGGGGSQPGILGYETAGVYRSSISCLNNADPNQTLGSFKQTSFIGNFDVVPDNSNNDVTCGLIAASVGVLAPLNGFYIGMLGTLDSGVNVAQGSVILAAQEAAIHNPAAGTSSGNMPLCSLVHGSKVAGATSSRTFNFGDTSSIYPTITSFDVDNSDTSGPDSSAIIESTLFSINNNFAGATFMVNTGGNLHDLLKASSTTLAPFFWNIFITVIAVSADGARAATWEIKALVKGTGVNSCSIIDSSTTQIFTTTPGFAGGVGPSLTTIAYTDPYEVPSGTLNLRGTGESGSNTSFYAYVRIQKLIRNVA